MVAAIRDSTLVAVLAETGVGLPHHVPPLTTRIPATHLQTTITMKGVIPPAPRHQPISSLLMTPVLRCPMKVIAV
jgi:hypothetical protein